MSAHQKFTTVEEYLAAVPAQPRQILEEIRAIIQRVAPDAKETISYQMPAFKHGRVFIYFAAFKRHIGIYPPVQSNKALLKDLAPYLGERGNLKFPLDQPMPYDLIESVVQALFEEHTKGNAAE